ncbi:MAG: hypothetical protein QNJ46_16730 [Leptolyngbyaceae cyanobacterium MO_188.B28]|nr:hypothetical protein [Leptolyngbyaceae cyanobacterium MO_188.B28]
MSYCKHLLPVLGVIPSAVLSLAAAEAAHAMDGGLTSLEKVSPKLIQQTNPPRLIEKSNSVKLARLLAGIPVEASSKASILVDEPFLAEDPSSATEANAETLEFSIDLTSLNLTSTDNLFLEDYLIETDQPSVSSAPLMELQSVGLESIGMLAAVPNNAEAPPNSGDLNVAQATKPLYKGMAPVYFGVGGNIGIEDSSNSATGEWGFTVFSKVSLGPRFSIRPALIISEDDISAPIPITYNFDPITLLGNPSQFFAGAGVDLGDRVGGLLNGGLDMAISDDFTLSAQTNWRFSEDVAWGIVLGVAYNFPWFFE